MPLRARLGAHRCYVVILANGTAITCARRLAAARSLSLIKTAQSGHRFNQGLPNTVFGFPFSSLTETWIIPP